MVIFMSYVDDDQSANTARFQAFAQGQDDELPPAWEMRASRSKVWLLVGIVVAVAVVAAVVAALVAG
jgi:hypothetical protein